VKQPKVDLRERTKNFALQIISSFPKLPRTTTKRRPWGNNWLPACPLSSLLIFTSYF